MRWRKADARWIPESLLKAPPLVDGPRLLRTLRGVEGQVWGGGRLLASQWWRYGPDVLQDLDVRDPVRFLDRLREREERGDIQPMDLAPLTARAIIEASATGTPPAVSAP